MKWFKRFWMGYRIFDLIIISIVLYFLISWLVMELN